MKDPVFIIIYERNPEGGWSRIVKDWIILPKKEARNWHPEIDWGNRWDIPLSNRGLFQELLCYLPSFVQNAKDEDYNMHANRHLVRPFQ